MPNIPCSSPENLCDDPSRPVTNYSAELPDRERFFGRAYNPTIPPPIGPIFTSTGCVGTCTSEISQQDANECAARQAVICFNEDNPTTNPDDPGGASVRPTPTYFNDEQTGTFTCPDGQVFSYTVPAGTVAKESLAAANASALSMAQNGAINNRICLGDLTPAACCADAEYTGTIDIVSPRVGQEGYTVEVSIVGGALPDGVTLTEDDDNITISGIPTTLGDSTFTIFAQLLLNGGQVSSVIRNYTISVLGIVQSILPEGTVGNAYSESFTITGTTSGDVTWALTGGALPAGLTLNSNGTVTGTPTAEGSYNFSVSFTDDNVTCSKDVTMEVTGGACCFSNTANIALASGPSSSCYAITDDRIIVTRSTNNLVFINATTDTVVGTIPAFGTVPSFLIYSPINNRAYCLDITNGDMLVINPTTMAHIATIPTPAAALQYGEPCYDATNNLIYWLASDILTNNYIFRLNPVTGIADVLATIPLPIAPAVQNWGKRLDHCSTNNRIYAPVFDDDGLGTTTCSIQVYNVAGVLQTTIATPGVVTSSIGLEMIYWDVTNGVLYYLSDEAVALAPGVIVINPADNSTIDTVSLNSVASACLSPNCSSLDVLTGIGGVYSVDQINTGDYSIICSTLTPLTAVSGAFQITSSPTKVYVPDVLGVRVVVMTPP